MGRNIVTLAILSFRIAAGLTRLPLSSIVPTWEAQAMLAYWQWTVADQGTSVANAQARQTAASGQPQEAVDQLLPGSDWRAVA